MIECGNAVDRILKLACIIGKKDLYINAKEIHELIKSTSDVVTKEEIDELTKSASEEDEDPEEGESAATEEDKGLSFGHLACYLHTFKNVSENVYSLDTNIKLALKFQHGLLEVAVPYKALFHSKEKENRQLPIPCSSKKDSHHTLLCLSYQW